MSKLILLVVAAAWAGVLLPPLLRSRLDARPGSSISSFRRQLSTLQRSVPGGAPQMRSMARPLSGPTRHHYAAGYHAPAARRSGTVVTLHDHPYRAESLHRPARMHPVARSRALAKQRRQNVLVILMMAVGASGLLTVATPAAFARYGLVLSLGLLVGYVYLLVQLRRTELERASYDAWQRAA
jgi:hypothetical protein